MRRLRGSSRLLCSLAAGGLWLGMPATAHATYLSSTAIAMAPGTFQELTGMTAWNNGAIFNPIQLGCTNGDWITEYANKATWDPVGLAFRFQGAAHGNCYAGKFVAYSDAS